MAEVVRTGDQHRVAGRGLRGGGHVGFRRQKHRFHPRQHGGQQGGGYSQQPRGNGGYGQPRQAPQGGMPRAPQQPQGGMPRAPQPEMPPMPDNAFNPDEGMEDDIPF